LPILARRKMLTRHPPHNFSLKAPHAPSSSSQFLPKRAPAACPFLAPRMPCVLSFPWLVVVYLVWLNCPKVGISVLGGRFLEQAIVFCCFPLALGVTHWYQKRIPLHFWPRLSRVRPLVSGVLFCRDNLCCLRLSGWNEPLHSSLSWSIPAWSKG